jgi:hypothetical protein
MDLLTEGARPSQLARGIRAVGTGLALASVVASVRPAPSSAQIISPGKLSSVHSELEGIRNCTLCHQLRQPGISPALCLKCHGLVADRLTAGRGFHASLSEEDCATCHKEHLGVDFALVRLDTLAFGHDATGYVLDGGHVEAGCRDCHTAAQVGDPEVVAYMEEHEALNRTYLGLTTACGDCHAEETPHREQFSPRPCVDCHDTAGWEDARGFDHREARYPLTGAHRTVACASCHESELASQNAPFVRYVPLASGACTDCHQDPHDGVMPGRCRSCHATTGWEEVDRSRVEDRFDHEATDFSLVGQHAEASCTSCHDAGAHEGDANLHLSFESGTAARAFPKPIADSCLACHRDLHDGEFQDRLGGSDCQSCHGQSAWTPADYGLDRHDSETSFLLEGAHQVVPCESCHITLGEGPPEFRLGEPTCAACHYETQPHEQQFDDRGCEACHTVASFGIPDFDHSETRYPLDGAHRAATCADCHRTEDGSSGTQFIRYRPLGTECRDCHGGDR